MMYVIEVASNGRTYTSTSHEGSDTKVILRILLQQFERL
jgi:hypothetical protein